MSKYKVDPLWPEGLNTYSLKSRKSKVSHKDFARRFSPEDSFKDFIEDLPDLLAGRDFKRLVHLIKEARKKNKPIIFSRGAHLIKVGLKWFSLNQYFLLLLCAFFYFLIRNFLLIFFNSFGRKYIKIFLFYLGI